jgi:hypothetical protein
MVHWNNALMTSVAELTNRQLQRGTPSTGTDYSGAALGPGTAALLAHPCPGMALHQRHAGTTAASGPRLEIAPSPATSTARENKGSRCQRRHTPALQAPTASL